MKNLILLFSLFIGIPFLNAQIVINELDCDTPGVDNKEFIELKSDAPNTSLDGYILVFFNGSTSGGDSSYFNIELDGYTTDENGLFLIGSDSVTPFPQLLISASVIQNGADAVALYQGNNSDFPEGTLATQTNLIDALVYDTNDSDDTGLMTLLGVTQQINEGSGNNTNSIQRLNDGSYVSTTPTPRQVNEGTGESFNAISISTTQTQYNEGESFDITFTTQQNVIEDIQFSFTLDNGDFNTSHFSGSTTLTILNGQNTVTTTITLLDNMINNGDLEPIIKFVNLQWPNIANNNFLKLRVIDNDFTVAPFGTPLNPTYGMVSSTQPANYYDSLNGLDSANLRQAIQNIIADPNIVRAQTYADVIAILKEADQSPENSNQVWLVYLEQSRSKLDYQTTSDNTGKWNREHTFPRSRAGFFSIESDKYANGIDNYWTTNADSLRHGNSDAHAIRAADGPENSSRGNQFYGQYNGPTGTLGSFKGDVARGVFYLAVRYNGLEIVNGFPDGNVGEFGDLQTLLNWNRNDPPDDFEMNRNNVIYTWQFNRNPFIDHPDLIEYIWGNKIGETWQENLSVSDLNKLNISIYPNPTKSRLFLNGIKNKTTITVFSIEGRKLFSKYINKDSFIDLNYASGLYLLKLTSNNKSMVKKVMIE